MPQDRADVPWNDSEDGPVVPRHIGYIVDGNRRWAKKHGLPLYEGHLAGYNALKDVGIATLEAGAEYMSAYVFSTENWKRSTDEVKRLMGLTLKVVTADVPLFNKYNVQLRIIGSRVGVDPKIVKAMAAAEEATKANTGGVFALCFNYGGQQEIVDAVKKIVHAGVKEEDVTPELIAENLYLPDVPPIDLIVRTSGEMRLSNFMLWRAAYSEIIFLDKMWPEMTKDDVTAIIKEYSRRQRRFGS
jgi:undecaprenyl diphosphate synthase